MTLRVILYQTQKLFYLLIDWCAGFHVFYLNKKREDHKWPKACWKTDPVWLSISLGHRSIKVEVAEPESSRPAIYHWALSWASEWDQFAGQNLGANLLPISKEIREGYCPSYHLFYLLITSSPFLFAWHHDTQELRMLLDSEQTTMLRAAQVPSPGKEGLGVSVGWLSPW